MFLKTLFREFPTTSNSLRETTDLVKHATYREPFKKHYQHVHHDEIMLNFSQSMENIRFRHTLRFEVRDHPGIFGHIGSIFERHSINIYALEQLPQYHRIGKEGEEIVIFTLTIQDCVEGLVIKALKEINQAEYMLKPVVLLREIV